MTDTKITVKIIPSLLESLSGQLSSCFVKRDAFIEHLIEVETPHLAKEMSGKRQSNAARRYISGELKRKAPKTVNVKIKSVTAHRLNTVIKDSNMVRDAFVNRIILLLTATPRLLSAIGLPETVTESIRSTNYINADLPASPLAAMQELISDPFWYFRSWDKENGNRGIYLRELDEIFTFLSCYMEDYRVPGTKAFTEFQDDQDVFDGLLLSPIRAHQGGHKDAK